MGLWKRLLRFEFRLSYDDDQHDGPALEKRVVNYLEAKVAAGRPAPVAAQLHRQNDAKLRLPAHHLRVGFIHSRQRILFDHGAHAGQFGEAQRILGIGRDS